MFEIYSDEFVKKIKKISPFELMYVSKILFRLVQLEEKKEDKDQQYINSLKKLEFLSIDVVKKGENKIFSSYFEPKYIEYVVSEIDISSYKTNYFK